MANTLFDNMSGAAINSPFKLQRATPLDTRSVVSNYSDLDLIVSGNAAYEGMVVWVTVDKKAYRYINGIWSEDSNGIDKNYLYYGSVDIQPSDTDDFIITVDTENNVAYVEGYNGTDTRVIIPYEYTEDGVAYPIVRITSRAFQNKTNITSVVIPMGVTWIGTNAFYGCVNLTEINIPYGISRIEASAFASTAINSIILPDSIMGNMGNGIFANCTNLIKVKMPEDLWYIPQNTFNGCSNLTSVILPKSVEEIYNNAFYGCSSLESINIPRTVTTIGTNVFDSDTLIICEQGSIAETYAIENGLNYKYDVVNPDIGGSDFQLYNITDLCEDTFYSLPSGYMLLYINDSNMNDVQELLYADEVYYDISGGVFTYGNIYLCKVTAEPVVSIDENINGAITIYSSANLSANLSLPIASTNQLGGIKLYQKSVYGTYQNASGLEVNPEDGTVWVNTADRYGITRDSSGNIRINPATIAEVIDGSEQNKPITPYTLNYALQQITISGVPDGTITKRHLVTALQEIYEIAQNQQEYSTSPQRIGTWIDGITPVWRVAIKESFKDMFSDVHSDYEAMINDDRIFSIHLPIKSYSISPLVITNSYVIETKEDINNPSFMVDRRCYEHNGNQMYYELNNELTLPTDYDELTNEGIYGWVEFATSESNVIQNLNGGTSNSLDLNNTDGGTESSTDTTTYNAGDADE